ncbi:MAG TPA: ZIP family metal transporter [Candidatus Paceibacterota bacterium]|jgi:ZIP family zinc transporter|nr:ZIP family metal transporter [Candidatus Paceibacterota bacterium]
MILGLIALAAFAATMLGGWLALRLRDRLHLILGFSAGAVIAVAFFDLMPEALELGAGYGANNILVFVALGFLLYLLLDRLLLLHSHADEHHDHTDVRGDVRAGSLSLHSLLDGIGIGLAFQVNAGVGLVVAVAVLAHDFSDGVNTISVITRHGGSYKKALRWLLVDAAAPVVGVAVTMFFSVTGEHLGALLALFAGFFLYIGASDLIPESHHAHPTFWTTATTIVGAAVLFAVVRLVGV